jgi:hypothetical protein
LKFKAGAYTIEIYSGEAPNVDTGDPRSRLVQTIRVSFPANQVTLNFPAGNSSLEGRLDQQQTGNWNIFSNGLDVIRSIEYVGVSGQGVPLAGDQRGDFRLLMATREVPDAAYQPRGGAAAYANAGLRQVHGLQCGHLDPYNGYYGNNNSTSSAASPFRGLVAPGGRNRDNKPALLPVDVNGVKRADGGPGDWDRGLSKHTDGALGNKVDEGNVWFNYGDSSDGGKVPYYRGRGIEETGRSYFSPNRQIASAVMFGSIPTGVVRGLPWQTLLFRPNRGAKSHPGAQTVSNPADHLMLDLFNLPVVEPYAISEPFSTGGKVNLKLRHCSLRVMPKGMPERGELTISP